MLHRLVLQNFRDVWRRNKSVRAEIGQILRTHTRGSISSRDYLVIDSAHCFNNTQIIPSQFNNGCPKFDVILKLFVKFSTKYQAWN